MDVEIIWSKDSINTLNLIYNYYIDIVGKNKSTTFINKLLNRVVVLILNPESGLFFNLKNQDYRYLIYSHYKIVYKLLKDNNQVIINILLIFDTRQNPSILFDKLENM